MYLQQTAAVNVSMRWAKCRNIIVALLMMAFIGQAVASATMSSQSQAVQSQSQEQMQDSASMDYSQHAGMNSVDEFDLSKCCPDCACSVGGCVTAVLPASQYMFASNLASLPSAYISPAVNPLTVSLFRPPFVANARQVRQKFGCSHLLKRYLDTSRLNPQNTRTVPASVFAGISSLCGEQTHAAHLDLVAPMVMTEDPCHAVRPGADDQVIAIAFKRGR